jgi:hypothetical protein
LFQAGGDVDRELIERAGGGRAFAVAEGQLARQAAAGQGGGDVAAAVARRPP